ncbi:MAG: OsmC family protein [Candidatus Hodarchaeota archaeon]
MKDSLTYDVEIEWREGMKGILKTKRGQKLIMDAPTEFGGKGDGFCPDELFAASLGGCALTTFFFLAQKMKIPVQILNISSSIKLGLIRGVYRIHKAIINMSVETETQYHKKVHRIFDLIKSSCNISGSIDNCIEIEYNIELKSNLSF